VMLLMCLSWGHSLVDRQFPFKPADAPWLCRRIHDFALVFWDLGFVQGAVALVLSKSSHPSC
jgi:hypothetical protein